MRNCSLLLRFLSVLAILILNSKVRAQVPIAQTMYGLSAWYIDLQSTTNTGLQGYWKKVKESGVRYVRIGGIDPNFRPGYSWQNNYSVLPGDYSRLKRVIDTVRSYGMEPIIEVGYNPVCANTISPFWNVSRANQAVIAGELVKRINKLDGLNIQYWIIANEPDLGLACFSGMTADDLKGYGYDVNSSYADTIAIYIKDYATQMKNQDSTISIIGPELAKFGNDLLGNTVTAIMNKLVSAPSNAYSIMGKVPGLNRYYIDILSYHYYASYQVTNQDSVINAPVKNTNGFRGNLVYSSGQWKGLIPMITGNSTGRDITNLKLACTEMNLDVSGSQPDELLNYPQTIKGYDSRSFLGGQFWADVYGQAMGTYAFNSVTNKNESWVTMITPWSVREGNSTKSFGYLGSVGANNGIERPTYVHYKLMTEHIKGVFYDKQSVAPTNKEIKAFASVDAPYGVKVMIMNQDTVNDYNFRVNFNSNNTNTSPSHGLTLNFDFATDTFFTNGNKLITDHYLSPKTPTDTLDNPIRKASTIVLWFTCEGTLFHRTDYTQEDAIAKNPPQITQLGDNVVNADMISCSLLPGGIGGSVSSNLSLANQIVPITSDLILASNVSLSFNKCLIIMSEGTKIEGTRQNAVNINNCIMVGCEGRKWQGIRLKGQWQAGESLLMDSTIIVNADTPVLCHRIPQIAITKNWMVNGMTAMHLSESKGFRIEENNLGAFSTGISTKGSDGNYSASIHGNRVMICDYPMHFKDDGHDLLDITCNDLEFRQTGIQSDNTTLKNQGSSSVGAGNRFKKTLWPDPSDYLDQNGGNNITYYYGPGEASMFPYSGVMNVTSALATNDPGCEMLIHPNCKAWPVGIEKPNLLSEMIINVYPNPSSGEFFLTLEKGSGTYKLTIHDIMGRQISARTVNFDSEKTVKFDIKVKGMYIVSLQNAEGRTTKKIIVE